MSSTRSTLATKATYLLLTHSTDNCDQQILALIKSTRNLVAHFTLRHSDIVLGRAISSHQVQEAIIDVDLIYYV